MGNVIFKIFLQIHVFLKVCKVLIFRVLKLCRPTFTFISRFVNIFSQCPFIIFEVKFEFL